MKFCQPHWDKLRAAIDARGLSAFIAKGGEDVAGRMKSELEAGATDRSNFEPLMGAHNAILSNALQVLTREAALHVLGGDVCPLCFINEGAKNDGELTGIYFDNWIERAADDALAKARELGLVAAG